MNDDEMLESVIGFEALYESMCRCRKNVIWKDSVAHYYLNGIEETLKLEKELKAGTYKPRPQKKIQITHPKPREAVSIAFRDRVYQRSLNDNVIYPAMTKQFIRDNAACQKGKGTDFARATIDRFLHEVYRKYGLDAWVLQGDIKGYYPNMSHRVAEDCFKKSLPPAIYERVEMILHNQYKGENEYNPGSQMIQIAGISVLSGFDHFIKEKLRIRWYLRYMDDFILIHHDREYLEHCLEEIKKYLASIEFEAHPEKTRIYPMADGIKMLGFTHKLTETGKVIRLINSENVRAERKKLYRLVQKAKRGEITKRKVNDCFEAWKAHARCGNCQHVIERMEQYYKSLWRQEGAENEHLYETQGIRSGTEENGGYTGHA
ncbi:MAG: hypothetical protein LUG61_11240 [Lachnospiraceae bacterium]|nr:hypothetical protein [Lachnospiraceae bacterium]